MREFDHSTTWADVKDMTIEEAIEVLKFDAESDGKEFSARPHKARAAQIAVQALQEKLDAEKRKTQVVENDTATQDVILYLTMKDEEFFEFFGMTLTQILQDKGTLHDLVQDYMVNVLNGMTKNQALAATFGEA